MLQLENLKFRRYINDCLNEFPDQLLKHFGLKPNMKDLEIEVRSKWDGHKITRKIIDAVQDKPRKYWDFQKFWFFPPGEKMEEAIEKLGTIEIDLDKESSSVIAQKLFKRLPWIQIVSVILRFVDPDRYGIISTPVEFVLWIQRGIDPVQTYDAYLKSLGEVGEKSGLKRIADVEMALMVHFLKLQDKDRTAKEIEKDPIFRKIRLQNVIDILFGNYDDFLEIGESLTRLADHVGQGSYKQISHLAGLLLSVKFEEIVIEKAINNGWEPKEPPPEKYSKLWDAAKYLENDERCKELKLSGREGCVEIRNDFVHSDRNRNPDKLSLLIKAIKTLQEL